MTAILDPGTLIVPALIAVQDTRGRWTNNTGAFYSRQLLSTDPVGTHALTLTNVVVDSRVHIESQDGTTVHYDALAVATTVSPTIDVYSAGSAKNDWRIRIRKGSDPYYQPYETLMTATVGSSSIFVSQVAD